MDNGKLLLLDKEVTVTLTMLIDKYREVPEIFEPLKEALTQVIEREIGEVMLIDITTPEGIALLKKYDQQNNPE